MTNTIATTVIDSSDEVSIHYDYVITGESGKKLAYKERDKEWVIIDAAAALDVCMGVILEQQNKK